MPRKNKDDGTSIWIIVAFIVLVIVIIIVLYPNLLRFVPLISFQMINVTGTVSVNGFGAYASNVTFIGDGTSNTVGVGQDESYQAMLQNGHVYNISVAWTAAGGLASGNCDGNALNLHSNTTRFSYNISC